MGAAMIGAAPASNRLRVNLGIPKQ
jgi:hypothetical protein